MQRGFEHNNNINPDLLLALIKEFEEDGECILAIDTDRNIVFGKQEGKNLLESSESDENIACFLDDGLEDKIEQFIQNNFGEQLQYKNLLITKLKNETQTLGIVFKTNTALQANWHTLIQISEDVISATNTKSLIEKFVAVIEKKTSTKNIFLALYYEKNNAYQLPYFRDEADAKETVESKISDNSFTNFVRISGKPLLVQKNEIGQYQSEYGIAAIGKQAESWLGVPIKRQGRTIGVFVVQSYDPDLTFTRSEQELLERACCYLAEGLAMQDAINEVKKNHELLEIANAITKISSFEYSVQAHCFYPIGKKLDALKLRDNKNCFSFATYLSEVKAEDKYLVEQGLRALKEENHQQFEREMKLKNQQTILKLFAFKTEKQNGENIVLGIVQDITHIKQNEKVLKSAYEKVQQADRLKSEFMTALSYEVRSPINAIIGFSNLMVNQTLSLEERKNYHRIVRQNGHSLIKIIDEVVDVSRLESGEVKIHKNPTDINRLLNNILIHSQKKAAEDKKRNLEITLHRNHNQMVIMTDETRLTQVLNTLMSNAITYTEQGYVQFGYHIIDRDQPLIEFFVKDTGSGIPDSKRDLLFQRYGRMEGNRVIRPGATSLGLSISKDLVRLMGGEMSVESKETQGTTFYFYLPYERAKDFEGAKISTKHLFIGKKDEVVRILVAEDTISNYKLIEESFITAKYKTRFAFTANGFEAIEKLRLEPFDIILMDLKMPLMDGMKTAEYIREKLPKPKNKIPLIALTANAMQETRRACLEKGFNGYITKPFLPDELVNKVTEILGL